MKYICLFTLLTGLTPLDTFHMPNGNRRWRGPEDQYDAILRGRTAPEKHPDWRQR